MKNILIISILLLVGFNGFGQVERTVTLQIDSLELNGCEIFSVSVTPGLFGISEEADKSGYRFNAGHPNFTCQVELKSDTSKIEIIIDDEGGYLTLENAYLLKSDTIRINRIHIIENCYRDTTFHQIDYYIIDETGSIGDPIKTKSFKSIEKDKSKGTPITEASYMINGKEYSVTFLKKTDLGIMITDYHGGYPKKYLKDRENYKGKVKYFHGHSTSSHYINFAEIKLK